MSVIHCKCCFALVKEGLYCEDCADCPKPITVEALIKILETMPKDAIVYSEGCDCTGEAASATIEKSSGSPDYVQVNRQFCTARRR
jgi:hypothetical protein